ncbi:MAG: MFS transporter [Alphaproteobacteria bacterium]|nr:MFS transporter [Alphaproteobacteria bacterium]
MQSRPPANEAVILGALFILNFVSTSQVMIVAPILPRIATELAVPEAWLGTLISAYGLMAGIASLLAGPFSDRYGRRAILLVGTGWMAVALGLHGLASTYASLLAVRALAGVAGGILGGVAVAYVGDWFPYERRGWANGWVMSGFALGQVLGIPLGAVLAQIAGFRAPFLVFAVGMVATFVLVWRGVPQPPVPTSERLSLGAALGTYASLLARVPTASATASYLLTFTGVGLYLAYLPTWLEDAFDVSGTPVAGMFLCGGLAAVVVNPLAGKASDRVGRKSLILASCLCFAAVSLVTPWAVLSFYWSYAVFALAMAAASMRVPPIQSLMSALVPSTERGSLMSLSSAFGQTGFALGGALAGFLYDGWGIVACTTAASVSVALMAVLVVVALPEPKGDEA